MTAIAAIALLNGEATPVSKTFTPVNIDSAGIARWADRSGGIALGYPVISFSLKVPKGSSRNYRLTKKLVLPILEQTSASTATGIQPAPTLSYNLIWNSEMILPERSTLAQRKDFIAFAKNLMANTAVIQAGVWDFESQY